MHARHESPVPVRPAVAAPSGLQPRLEGATRILVPATNLANPVRAPGAREKGQPFYNPGMALNRDLSVLLVEAFAKQKGREIDVADALAGTGARALRLATEVDAPVIVHANDAQAEAVAALRQAISDPGRPVPLRHPMESNESDAHAFLARRKFDVIDLDPCGSPMAFADAAMRSVRHGGLVCATATDTAALAGAFPKACRRRYDAHHGLHVAPWRAEVGLRILAGALVRSAARFERTARPVLSVAHGHWMRVVVQVEDGKGDADDAIGSLADCVWEAPGDGAAGPHAAFVPRGLGHAWAQNPGEGPPLRDAPAPRPAEPTKGPSDRAGRHWAGPLWPGPLHEAQLVAAMREIATRRTAGSPMPLAVQATRTLMDVLAQEATAPAFWLEPDLFQKAWGSPPRRDELIARLRAAGWRATRAHGEPQGVRTDAPVEALRAAWTPHVAGVAKAPGPA